MEVEILFSQLSVPVIESFPEPYYSRAYLKYECRF